MRLAHLKLKAYASDKGYSRKELGEILGITQSYVSMILNMQRRPSYETMINIESLTARRVRVEDWAKEVDTNAWKQNTARIIDEYTRGGVDAYWLAQEVINFVRNSKRITLEDIAVLLMDHIDMIDMQVDIKRLSRSVRNSFM